MGEIKLYIGGEPVRFHVHGKIVIKLDKVQCPLEVVIDGVSYFIKKGTKEGKGHFMNKEKT